MTNKAGKPKSSQRTVRIFISSTFRDMQEEREELVKQVFPELRKRCRERGVEFTDVDLRWGVTEERSQRGEVLPICLAEIEKCRPYFICHLGNRYGWVPGEIDQELIEDQSWLKAHQQKSVTELEILHGVLENPAMEKRAFFYFRDPAVSEQIEQQLIQEPDYRPESPESKDKLVALKAAIHDSGYPPQEYPNAQSFGARVLQDLWAAIDREYPEGTKPSPLERERMDHEAFAEVRRKTYIGRAIYDQRLNDHVAGAGEPLVLLGESGAGKSALIANWMEKHRKARPDDFMIARFIGGTPDSADYVTLLRGIMMEIRARYKPETPEAHKEDDIPSDPEKVKDAFPGWLARAAAMETKTGGRFILILDGLNQLNDRDNAPDLGWLPGVINTHVRLLLSTLPGRSLEALEKRGWPSIEIEPLEIPERDTFIVDYLVRFGKELSVERRQRITQTPQSANPLYLRTLLEELRIFGIHEKLDDRIDHYLDAKTVEALFTKVLERYEQDYEREEDGTTGLTREAMSLIWAARNGLSEEELLELLGTGDQLLPQANWSPLYLAAEESLVNRSGLLSFFHDFMRRAVESRYLGTEEEKQKAHLRLADFFDRPSTDDRKVDELPWQLQHAKRWERLKNCVSDIVMFLECNIAGKEYDLVGYWLMIGSRFDMAEAYYASLGAYEVSLHPSETTLASTLSYVSGFLMLNTKYTSAEALERRALLIREEVLGERHPDTANSLNSLAVLLKKQGIYADAEQLHRRALLIREEVLGEQHQDTANSLHNLAAVLKEEGDYVGAASLYRRALLIDEEVLGERHPDTANSLNSLAVLLQTQGISADAEQLHRRALLIREEVLGELHPDTADSLDNLAALLKARGDYADAEQLHRRALLIREDVLGERHPDTAISLSNLAELLKEQGDYVGAESLYRRALLINEGVLGERHPDTVQTLNNFAALREAQGDHTGADSLYRQAFNAIRPSSAYMHVLSTSKKEYDEQLDMTTSLDSQAFTIYSQGDFAGAEPLYRRVLSIREELLGKQHPDTVKSLNDLAVILESQENFAGAEPLFRQALTIREAVLGERHLDTAKSLSNLAVLLHNQGNFAGAGPLYWRALLIQEALLGERHPDTVKSLNDLAQLLNATNRHADAKPLYGRVLATEEGTYGPDHPRVASGLDNLGITQYRMGDLEGARESFERAYSIFRKSLGEEHPNTQSLKATIEQLDSVDEALATSTQALNQATDTFGSDSPRIVPALTDLANLYRNLKWFEKSELLHREALAIREKQLGSDHPDTAESLYDWATFLFQQERIAEALPYYKQALEIYETNVGKSVDIPRQWLNNLAICHNQIAFHEDVPAENWLSAEAHYCQAMEQYHQAGQDNESVNTELNLQVMFHFSSQPVDAGRVKELTRILEQANDPRAGKGHDLLK